MNFSGPYPKWHFLYWREEAVLWCRGKNGWIRIPVLFWFFYSFFKLLTTSKPETIHFWLNLLAPVNLAFHEMGHLLFGYFGQFLGMLGGTLLECLMPFLGMWHFYKQKDFFSIALCFGWLATVFLDVARYVGDARKMEIPLVSLSWGTTVIHDWNYLLGHWGLLSYDFLFSFLLRCAATLSMGICLFFGVWLIVRMIRGNPSHSPTFK